MVKKILNRTLPCATAKLFLATGLICLAGLICEPTIAAVKAGSDEYALPTLSFPHAATAEETIQAA